MLHFKDNNRPNKQKVLVILSIVLHMCSLKELHQNFIFVDLLQKGAAAGAAPAAHSWPAGGPAPPSSAPLLPKPGRAQLLHAWAGRQLPKGGSVANSQGRNKEMSSVFADQ